jgi:hypothetical protein
MSFKKSTYNLTAITAMTLDSINQRVWIAYTLNTAGVCLLRCYDANQPLSNFYAIELSVDKVQLITDDTYLYAIYESDTLLAERFNKTNPLSTRTTISRPVGLVDMPVACLVDSTPDFYVLTPGILDDSTRIYKYDSNLSLLTEIDLNNSGDFVNNATSMVFSGTDIWLTTNETPAKLVRVYDSGGYTYTINIPSS